MKNKLTHSQTGFTLIELSIVLVIIALITGSIIVGQSLIRNSQLRSVVTEYARYSQALTDFNDKYKALPGDFAAAEAIWGSDSSCPTTSSNTVVKITTCNGDGNGSITTNVAGTRLDEQFRAWQHLANAKMVDVNGFPGVQGSAGVRDRVPGQNIPASKLTGAGWGLISVTSNDIANSYTQIPYTAPDLLPNHVLWFGGRSISGTVDNMTPVLSPDEAWDIDKKSDDGVPGTGKIVSQTDTGSYACIASSAYKVTSTKMDCALVFKTGL